MKLQTYLNFNGQAEAAFLFYQSVFGGEITSIVRFADMPMEGVVLPENEQNKIMHIALSFGENNVLMASDILESLGMQLNKGNNSYIFIGPDSKAEADNLFNRLSVGGVIEQPLADQPWGDYFGSLQDQFGILWMVNFIQQKSRPDRPVITVETTVNVPTEKAWTVWTDPTSIKQWNQASEDWHTTNVENDLRVGGRFSSRMEAKDGSMGFDFYGIYDEVILHQKLAYTLGDARHVTVNFVADGNQTKVIETFEAESENSIELQQRGWQSIMDSYRQFAES
ncbi:MAG: SRPBCC domain-containing protein [Eubacteriales bacterium]|nr:SRPBCC domain-containing protein [Eubacteriales bacterium]